MKKQCNRLSVKKSTLSNLESATIKGGATFTCNTITRKLSVCRCVTELDCSALSWCAPCVFITVDNACL